MARRHSREISDARRTKAQSLQEEWAKLTPVQQLAALDKRLGAGEGAKKQRALLAVLIEKAAARKHAEKAVKIEAEAPKQEAPKVKAKERRTQERADRPAR